MFLCLGWNCGARHFSSHWNQLFLLVLCCLMNFFKISQDWWFMITLKLTFTGVVCSSYVTQFLYLTHYSTLIGTWFMMFYFAVHHGYNQSRTWFRRWNTSIRCWHCKSWYKTNFCWSQVWNRGRPISEAVTCILFLRLDWHSLNLAIWFKDLNASVSHGSLRFPGLAWTFTLLPSKCERECLWQLSKWCMTWKYFCAKC